MSPRGTRPRTLLVGPLGPRPWISRNELVAQLEDLGHDVEVNGVGGPELVPPLEPLPSRVGVVRNSLPSMAFWFARMLWRWRRVTNGLLAEANVDHIVVWDSLLAGLCRLARPTGTEVVWVASHGEVPRFYQSIVHAALAITADRVVVSSADDGQWVRGDLTFSRWPRPAPSGAPLFDGWVVLGSSVPPDDETLARLAREAAREPAAAVIFDARNDDRVAPWLTEQLRTASGAVKVWWASGDEWLEWLGGVPTRAIDPGPVLEVDQRHVRVLSDGGSLLAAAGANGAQSTHSVTAAKAHDGWTEFELRVDAPSPQGESDWAEDVFGDRSRPIRARIAAQGVAVAACPLCGSHDRRGTARTYGATTILQCRACGLRHASLVLRPYVEGAGDLSTAIDSVHSAAAHRQLDALDELGVARGRLLYVGADASSFLRSATHRGWTASGVGVDELGATAQSPLFDVVVFDRSLETTGDPVAALRQTREHYLQAGGQVVIDTPNAGSLSRYAQRSHWDQWRPGERVTYPDLWTVRQLLQRGGFQIQVLRTDSSPDAPATGADLARQVGFVSDRLARLAPPVAAVLARPGVERRIRIAARWIDRRGFGLNIIAVGRAI